jgi:C4-dicarboxylate transporter DctM subunit
MGALAEPIIGIIALIILLVVGVPVAFSMLTVGFVGLVLTQGWEASFVLTGSTMYHAISNWLYIVIPMFILMGEFAGESGAVEDMFAFFKSIIGRVPGTLSVVTIMTSAILAFTTGSSLAATVVMCRISLPEMDRNQYDRQFSLENILGGGLLGNLIPPSIGLTLFGIITEQSIGKLLLAGILPGLLMTALELILIFLRVKWSPGIAPPSSGSRLGVLGELWKTWPILLLGLIVLGSIYTGLTTVTEAATMGACGAFLLGIVKRRLTFRTTVAVLERSVMLTGTIFILLASVSLFSRFLTLTGFTHNLTELVIGLNLSPVLFFMAVYAVFLFFGCLVDATSLMLLLVPLIFPIVVKLGFDPIWFGVITVVLIQIGQITPPVGMCVYVLSGVAGIPLQTCFAAARNVFIIWVIGLVLLSVFPAISLWLPARM